MPPWIIRGGIITGKGRYDMFGACGWMFWPVHLIIAIAALVWFYYSIRFFIKAAEYYNTELAERQKKDAQMQDLLAKFDQLVDVLKVK
jgi:hypothetical protein